MKTALTARKISSFGPPRASIRAGGVERSVSFVEADDDLRAAMDEAYRAKYGSGMYVDAMVAPSAAEAALKMVP